MILRKLHIHKILHTIYNRYGNYFTSHFIHYIGVSVTLKIIIFLIYRYRLILVLLRPGPLDPDLHDNKLVNDHEIM